MPVSERAKQFMPFAALRGLPEALREMEKTVVPKMILTEEQMEELDSKLHQIKCGRMLSVVYFHENEYRKLTGMVAEIDVTRRLLQIVSTRIAFEDICDITF